MRAIHLALALMAFSVPLSAAARETVSITHPETLSGFTLLKPAQKISTPLPIVLWSNGGCTLDNGRYLDTLANIAEHGFLVLAIGKPGPARRAAPADATPQKAMTLSERMARIKPPISRTSDLTAALDWAQREAGRKGGDLYGKLATDKVAVMGHSCGGMHALEASLDPRISTTIVWSSGLWRYGGSLTGIALDRPMLQRLHAPVLYLHGGATDIAHNNGEGDFVEINHVPIFKASRPAPHGLTFEQPDGGPFGTVGLAWLQWQLQGDKTAARMFAGADCSLCTDSEWAIEKKKID